MRSLIRSTGVGALLLLLALPVPAQRRFQTPVESSGFTRLTSCDMLQAFLDSLDGRGRCTVRPIARTSRGRTVSAVLVSSSPRFGDDRLKLRVMLFAQQHGDEPSGKEALTLLLARFAGFELDRLLSRIDLIVVPQMNPDGAELGQRRTADDVDLNRTHLLLSSAETRGLHDLFDAWWPEVTMDIHEYGTYSRAWSDSGFVKSGDVQLGMLTNLNSSGALRLYERDSVFPFIAAAMRRSGYSYHEYIVGSPSEYVRYSTTEPNDGRQSFGLLNTLSFIQEGRGGREPGEGLERRARSQAVAVEGLLTFCADHAAEIRSLVARERLHLTACRGLPVVLCMDHFPGGRRMVIPVRRVPSGTDTLWQVHPLRDLVKPLSTRPLPAAYIIPGNLAGIREVLDRNHVQMEIVSAPRRVEAVACRIERVLPDTLEDEWHPRPSLRLQKVVRILRPGDMIVRTDQTRALFLAVLLEPESMWGLVKYSGFSSLLEGKEYPILRLP
ncbi:MAG TPA: M14 family zinc carboxypeptidase [Bacteroidota bacterium]|nr:M14 family zinc carboxypeptidase [Bacteroidota bacterium]